LLRIRAELRKCGKRDKSHRLPLVMVDVLRALFACPHKDGSPRTPDDVVLPWLYADPHYLWQRYKVILKRAGLPTGRARMFHAMRKTVATYYELAGGDATRLLDHSSRKVTERYLDPRYQRDQHPADLLFGTGAPAPAPRKLALSPPTAAEVAAAIPLGRAIVGTKSFGPNLWHVVPMLRFIAQSIDRTGKPPKTWQPIQNAVGYADRHTGPRALKLLLKRGWLATDGKPTEHAGLRVTDAGRKALES